MIDKNADGKYSQYDCELSYTDYNGQASSYLDVEHYNCFVSDEDMTIPTGFDPYCVPIIVE